MSYNPYTPQASGQAQSAANTFSYQYLPPAGTYTQNTPTTSPYPATYQTPYPTGITGYGSWHYPYGYVAQQAHTYGQRITASIPTAGVPSATGLQRTAYTGYASPYAPYRKDSAGLAATMSRSPRKQSNFKGLFAKERELNSTIPPDQDECIAFTSQKSNVWIWR